MLQILIYFVDMYSALVRLNEDFSGQATRISVAFECLSTYDVRSAIRVSLMQVLQHLEVMGFIEIK